MEIEMKDKLISLPVEVLNVLASYKSKTGISATDYIRTATIRKMIVDGLIFFKTKYVTVEKESNGDKLKLQTLDAIESNKFCDGDSCEISPLVNKSC